MRVLPDSYSYYAFLNGARGRVGDNENGKVYTPVRFTRLSLRSGVHEGRKIRVQNVALIPLLRSAPKA